MRDFGGAPAAVSEAVSKGVEGCQPHEENQGRGVFAGSLTSLVLSLEPLRDIASSKRRGLAIR